MNFTELLSEYGFWTLGVLSVFAFLAGFVDAVAGGGGLIQLPALLIQFPNTAIPTLFGTNKIAAFSGTSISAIQYGRRIRFDFKLLAIVSFFAALASYAGASVVSYIDVQTLKPIILVILIVMVVYTILKKDLGLNQTKELTFKKQAFYGAILAVLLGFYDGFFGPGTGSFFVLGFVLFLGFEFIQASAYAKVINCVTNISAIYVFVSQGFFMPWIALLMAVFNIAGTLTGTRMALRKGNAFVRIVFIVVVSLLIIRYAYDLFQ
jgi:uncharacterized membrane protein YfcA